MLKRLATTAVQAMDQASARATLGLGFERPRLLGLMFHHLFVDEAEARSDDLDPHQPVTVTDFQTCVRHFQQHGYQFVSPTDIIEGLDPDGHYALLTFDEGYATFMRALPVLHALSVPATLFVVSGTIRDGRAFWWDVLYRERRRQGASVLDARSEVWRWKLLDPAEVDARLEREFGAGARTPRGEIDRPISPHELQEITADPLITIGNHTGQHPRLTHLPPERAARELRECQTYLSDLLGAEPTALSYPDGDHNPRVEMLAQSIGLRLAVTTVPRWHRLPLSALESMQIGRYELNAVLGLAGSRPLEQQLRSFRSEVQVLPRLIRVRQVLRERRRRSRRAVGGSERAGS